MPATSSAPAILGMILLSVCSSAAAATSCSAYTESGPIVATRNNQVIRNLTITSTHGPAIVIKGFSGVTVDHVIIHHNGGPGIIVNNAPATTIENADILFDGAPRQGANPSSDDDNISCYLSSNLSVTNARLTRGSAGIAMDHCDGGTLSFIEGHDQRGPFPRGQLVQWIHVSGGTLTDFSDENSIQDSWTEDNINAFKSSDITIARGLVDGNNSPSGVGVIADAGTSNMTVQDVDAIHQGNGCFSSYGGPSHDVTFINTRCRDNYCSLPRGKPLSNSLAWAIGSNSGADMRIENSSYYNLCNAGNIVWNKSRITAYQIREQDFTPRAAIRVQLCQYGY